jgi:hypothetical protein
MTLRLRAMPGYVRWGLALLVGFRVVLSLAVLADSGHRLLPGFPRYEYEPLPGDAYGFYAAAREILSALQRDAVVVWPAVLLAVVASTVAYRRRARIGPAGVVVAIAWSIGLVALVLAALVHENGAAVIGWSLVWSVPLLPLRLAGALDPDVAFAVGLGLSLICIAAIVVGTYVVGRAVTASERTGFAAAALVALWPLIVLVLGGHRGTENGTWQNDLGLSLYTEPFSTALVVVAVALVVAATDSDAALAAAGALLGFSVAVRLSNVLLAACVVGVLLLLRRSAALWAAAGAAAFAPAVLAYWPKGYAALEPPVFPEHPFALSYARDAWSGSLLWHPSVLLIVLPLAVVGTFRVRPWHALLLWSCVLTTAVLYTFYELTPLHPRFLFVVVPFVLVLCAAGAALVLGFLSEQGISRTPSTIGRR